jgi:hypothetical protein
MAISKQSRMKNWIKRKLHKWLFTEDEFTVNHRIINVPAEVITLQSIHQISSRELDEMIVRGRLTKEAAIQMIYNEACEKLFDKIRKGGFIQTNHITNHSFLQELGTNEMIELKLMLCKPKY